MIFVPNTWSMALLVFAGELMPDLCRRGGFPINTPLILFEVKQIKYHQYLNYTVCLIPYILNYKYVALISRKYFLRQILRNLLMSRLKSVPIIARPSYGS